MSLYMPQYLILVACDYIRMTYSSVNAHIQQVFNCNYAVNFEHSNM